jgi:predicted nucleic acid-binding protein
MKAVLDTRFFMDSLVSKDVSFRKWARATLDTFEKTNSGVIPSIVILELYKLQLEENGKDAADARIASILQLNLDVIDLDPQIAIQAAKLRCKYGELPTADAIIAATAIITRSDCVLTDDKHIKQIREIKTRWF